MGAGVGMAAYKSTAREMKSDESVKNITVVPSDRKMGNIANSV